MQIFVEQPELLQKNESKSQKIIKGLAKLWNFCFRNPFVSQFDDDCRLQDNNKKKQEQKQSQSILINNSPNINNEDVGPFINQSKKLMQKRKIEKDDGKIINFNITKQDNKILIDLRQANISAKNYKNGFFTYTPFFNQATKQKCLNRQSTKKQCNSNIKMFSLPYKRQTPHPHHTNNTDADKITDKRSRTQLLRKRYYKILQKQQIQSRMHKYRLDNTHKPITINLDKYSTSVKELKNKYGKLIMQKINSTVPYPYQPTDLSSVSQAPPQYEQNSGLYEESKLKQAAIKTQKPFFPREEKNIKELMQKQYVSPLVSLYVGQKQNLVGQKISVSKDKQDKEGKVEQKLIINIQNRSQERRQKQSKKIKIRIQQIGTIKKQAEQNKTQEIIAKGSDNLDLNNKKNPSGNNTNNVKVMDAKNVPEYNPFLLPPTKKLCLQDVISGKYDNNNKNFNYNQPFISSNSNICNNMGYNTNTNTNYSTNTNANTHSHTNLNYNSNMKSDYSNNINFTNNINNKNQHHSNYQDPQSLYKNQKYNNLSHNLQSTYNSYEYAQSQNNFLSNTSAKQAMAMFMTQPALSNPPTPNTQLFTSIFHEQSRQNTTKKGRSKKPKQTRIC